MEEARAAEAAAAEKAEGKEGSDSSSNSSSEEEENKEEKLKRKAEQVNEFWNKALLLMSSPQYELAMNIITVCNVFTVFVRALETSASESTIKQWIIIQMTINLTMLFETLSDIYVQGGPIKAYRYHFRIWPETLC